MNTLKIFSLGVGFGFFSRSFDPSLSVAGIFSASLLGFVGVAYVVQLLREEKV